MVLAVADSVDVCGVTRRATIHDTHARLPMVHVADCEPASRERM
jgi:hypothetical protein